MKCTALRLLGTAAILGAVFAWPADWPQFRGPHSTNRVEATELPATWSAEENLAWHTRIPGRGWSSPVIWGNKVFVTSAVMVEKPAEADRRLTGGKFSWEVRCLDLTTGIILWKQVATSGSPRIATHRSNTYASESPLTDGERLYVYFGMTGLFCYGLDGELLWKKDLGAYAMQGDWGTSSSPALHEEKLYLQIDNEEDSFLVALDRTTGDEIWRIAREEKSNWSTPVIWRNKHRTELVTAGQKVRSYHPDTGKLLWELSIGGGRCTASPTGAGELLYVGSEAREGGGGFLFAVKAGATGDITPAPGESTSASVLWSQPNAGPPMASPLIHEGLVYILQRRNGIVSAYNAQTGETAYRKRMPGAQAFWATPWIYDGKIFCLDDSGTTHVLKPGPEFEVLAQNSIDDQFWASPAFADGSIVLRGVDGVYCVRK